MSSSPVRLAVFGLGMASKPHLEALAALRGQVEVSGVWDRNPEKVAVATETYGFPGFDSPDAIAADRATDGVILLTPPNFRREPVQLFARAGKHILSEKPVERTTAAATEIVEICEAAGVKLGIVLQHRFRAGALRLAEAVTAGDLGEISTVRATLPWWRPQSYYDSPGRGTIAKDGGGVLLTQAIHLLDLMLSVAGPVSEVQAMASTTPLHRMECEDFVAGGMRFASGAAGSLMATTATYPGAVESLVIDGTRANATLLGGQLTITGHDDVTETIGEASATGGGADPMAFTCDWHRDLIASFAEAIRTNSPPVVSGRDALQVHRLIDALMLSSRDGCRIDVETGGATNA